MNKSSSIGKKSAEKLEELRIHERKIKQTNMSSTTKPPSSTEDSGSNLLNKKRYSSSEYKISYSKNKIVNLEEEVIDLNKQLELDNLTSQRRDKISLCTSSDSEIEVIPIKMMESSNTSLKNRIKNIFDLDITTNSACSDVDRCAEEKTKPFF